MYVLFWKTKGMASKEGETNEGQKQKNLSS